ncbi:hypothetical protein B0J14DRAFT_571571 [Halenospora varia]|nr:hypothetical protein B0J14DRAFT_571571 [Halenospora varia]
MRLSHILSLIFVGLVSAEWEKFPAGKQSAAARGLLADRECRTCAECWGVGSIVCSLYNCFNPTLGEQCCGSGYNCVGPDNSCCGHLGPGVTGSDGVPSTSSLPTPPTPIVRISTPSTYMGSSTTSTPNSVTGIPTTTQTGRGSSTSLAATATSTNVAAGGAAIRNTIGGIAVAVLCALGMALL